MRTAIISLSPICIYISFFKFPILSLHGDGEKDRCILKLNSVETLFYLSFVGVLGKRQHG